MARDDIGIGRRIRTLREERGLRLWDLARLAFISEGSLRQVESGETKAPTLLAALRLAYALGVTPEYLATGDPTDLAHSSPGPEPVWKSLIDSMRTLVDIERRVTRLQDEGSSLTLVGNPHGDDAFDPQRRPRSFSALAVLAVYFNVLPPGEGVFRESFDLLEHLLSGVVYGARISTILDEFGSDRVVAKLSFQFPVLREIPNYNRYLPSPDPVPSIAEWTRAALAILNDDRLIVVAGDTEHD